MAILRRRALPCTTTSTLHPVQLLVLGLRDLEKIKIRDLRRIFGCSFRCNLGRIAGYVTGVATEDTAKKTSKVRILIFSKALT